MVLYLGVVDDEDEATKLASKLVEKLIDCNALCFKSAAEREAERAELESKRLAMLRALPSSRS